MFNPTKLSLLAKQYPPLLLYSLVMSILGLFLFIGIFADPRIITGAPAWLKPTKFAISTVVYSITMIWLLKQISTARIWKRRLVKIFAWITALVFTVEMIPITLQAIRGTTSHFNAATPLDSAMYSVMGTAITILWLCNLIIAFVLFTERHHPPALLWALRLGVIITSVGMAEGFLMTDPTPEQIASWHAGAPVTKVGAHSVGVKDGGLGLPFVNWSIEGGDLRPAHFVGLHALQIIPLLGLFLIRLHRLNQQQQTALVFTGAGSYLAVVLLLTWQALRAQPIIRPDVLTMSVFAGIVIVTLTLAAIITARIDFGFTRALKEQRT